MMQFAKNYLIILVTTNKAFIIKTIGNISTYYINRLPVVGVYILALNWLSRQN